MSNTFRFLCLGALIGAFLFSGCTSTDQQQRDQAAASASGQGEVSTIPWNRPEKWEGPGILGGQLNPQGQ